MNLPNQTTTWGHEVESFEDWKGKQTATFASDRGALVAYLAAQLKIESGDMVNVKFTHPILGLVSYLGEKNNRAHELLYAYLALTVADDDGPALALISGRRLNPHLHPEYVHETRCYG